MYSPQIPSWAFDLQFPKHLHIDLRHTNTQRLDEQMFLPSTKGKMQTILRKSHWENENFNLSLGTITHCFVCDCITVLVNRITLIIFLERDATEKREEM